MAECMPDARVVLGTQYNAMYAMGIYARQTVAPAGNAGKAIFAIGVRVMFSTRIQFRLDRDGLERGTKGAIQLDEFRTRLDGDQTIALGGDQARELGQRGDRGHLVASTDIQRGGSQHLVDATGITEDAHGGRGWRNDPPE